MLAVVCDASPLVYLSRLGQFDLLRRLYEAVLIPPAVWQEVGIGGEGRLESENLKLAISSGWIKVEPPKDGAQSIAAFPKDMGRGEREAIILAHEKRAVLVTDDALGRAAGEALGLEVTGTIGVLIRAKRHSHLASVRPFLDRLKGETNFRMSQAVYGEALRLAEETLPPEPPGKET